MSALSADQLDHMRALWENAPELNSVVIGERFGVSKNVVIGHAARRGWASRKGPRNIRRAPAPSTISARLDALHAKLDRVLAETRATVEADRQKRAVAELRKAAA